MLCNRFTPEKIIGMVREAEVRLSQGEKVKGLRRRFGITEQTHYRWRKDYTVASRFRRPGVLRNLRGRMVV